jgi:hypothetical protein
VPFLESKGKSWMKRIAALTVLVMLSGGLSMPTKAQGTATENDRKAEKLAEKKQKALYKYQMQQQKAQQKAQRDADKKQQKAAKKYDKEQRKMLKDATVPAKHSS